MINSKDIAYDSVCERCGSPVDEDCELCDRCIQKEIRGSYIKRAEKQYKKKDNSKDNRKKFVSKSDY